MTVEAGLLAAQNGIRCLRILPNGDSFLEGQGASTLLNRPMTIFGARVRTEFDLPGNSPGWFPAFRHYVWGTSLSWRDLATGTATTAPNWNITQGMKGVRFTASGQTRQWTVNGSAVDIHYLRSGGGGSGVLNILVDGVAAGSINTNAAGYQPSMAHRLVFAAPGSHTVRLTSASAAQCIVDGIQVYSGEHTGGGVLVYDCTRSQAKSNLIAVDDILNGWDAIAPDLIIDDQWGNNDFIEGALTPAQTAANLLLRLNKSDSLASEPTHQMVIPWRMPELEGTNALGATYQQYLDEQMGVIDDHPYKENVKILDLEVFYPTATEEAWHDPDGLHPNNTGHQKIADALFTTIFPPPAPTHRFYNGLGEPVQVFVTTDSGLEVPRDIFKTV